MGQTAKRGARKIYSDEIEIIYFTTPIKVVENVNTLSNTCIHGTV